MADVRVCLILEGSYPFITGGVSSWMHQLITALPDIDFSLFTISPSLDQPLRYELPPNVKEHKDINIGERFRSKRKPNKKKELLKEIEQIHRIMEAHSAPSLDIMMELMPDGYYLYSDALRSKTGWRMITGEQQVQ